MVVAYDGGEPPRSGTLVIDVEVRDINDNVPQFPDNATFEATVDENVPVGTVIATLRADDADTGTNAEISYQLSPETARDFGRVFGVRANSGELFTKTALDHETRTEYALYVTASDRTGSGNDVIVDDGAGRSLSSQALVMVRVRDVNDNPPRINVHVLSSSPMPPSPVPPILFPVSVRHATPQSTSTFCRRRRRLDRSPDCARKATTTRGISKSPRAFQRERSSPTSRYRTPTQTRTAASGVRSSKPTASSCDHFRPTRRSSS